MGLVAVALLTLAPLALRPVRLACLIHAANVHSEPGSNPSKVGVNVEGVAAPPPRLPLPVGNEDADCGRTGTSCVSNRSAAGFERPPFNHAPKPKLMRACWTTRRRLPSRVHSFRSTTDRIVKEPAPRRRFRPGRPEPLRASHSGRLSSRLVVVSPSGESHLNRESFPVNTLPGNFCRIRFLGGLGVVLNGRCSVSGSKRSIGRGGGSLRRRVPRPGDGFSV